jgi:hypothetical protein
MPRRLAVVVLGMHRSGTSAIAGTAVRLGLTAPATMLPPSVDNPSGFYESVKVTNLNQWLLRQAGCGWYDCLQFDINHLSDPTRAAAADMVRAVLREEFADAPAIVLKDPRLCLTLPVWVPVLRAAGMDLAVLLAIRHPAEALRSLSVRDHVPETEAAAVWLHYTLEAERASRSLPRAVVEYDDLLNDWRGCMTRAARAAGITWPAGIGPDRPDIDAFLSRSLRHHVAARREASVGSLSIRGLIDLTWSAQTQLRDDPASPFAPEWLDQAHATFAARRAAARTARLTRADIPRPDFAVAGPLIV